MKQQWAPVQVRYLDSATYGIPSREALSAFHAVTAAWGIGEYDAVCCDAAVTRARSAYARIHGVRPQDVAIGHQVAPFVAAFAAAIERDGHVLTATGDFTSLLFPLAATGREMRTVPLERLAESVDADTAIVAVSAAQSANGRLADLDRIAAAAGAHGAHTLIDSTQASGWLALDASRFDAVVTGGYKWLCHPRGTAFMTVGEQLAETVPATANWYAAEDPWATCYGLPLRMAADARRFDISPAWLNWHAAATSLEQLEAIGIDEIHAHNIALAARVRAAYELEPLDSAIVSLAVDDGAADRLQRAGIKASLRAGRLRISCHHYNDDDDIDRLLEVLGSDRSSTQVDIRAASDAADRHLALG
jgi:selenocysteine lyase/cysteine desulfurase